MLSQRRLARGPVLMPVVVLVLLALIALLAACGGSDSEPAPVTPVTETPVPPPLAAFPTWTLAPSPTLPPVTITLAPSSTAPPDPTFPPPAETGVRQIGDQYFVTVLEPDLGEAITRAYLLAGLAAIGEPPVVTVSAGYQLEVEMVFSNTFLNQESRVTTQTLLAIVDGEVRLEELQQQRWSSGALPVDADIWATLDAIEVGINTAIHDLIARENTGGDVTLIGLRHYIGPKARLEAVFAAQGS